MIRCSSLLKLPISASDNLATGSRSKCHLLRVALVKVDGSIQKHRLVPEHSLQHLDSRNLSKHAYSYWSQSLGVVDGDSQCGRWIPVRCRVVVCLRHIFWGILLLGLASCALLLTPWLTFRPVLGLPVHMDKPT